MTDTPELASLTIKDLRQLAGEHNIQNRSRLGKDELIQALSEAMASRGATASGDQPAEATAFAAASASGRQPSAVDDDVSADAEESDADDDQAARGDDSEDPSLGAEDADDIEVGEEPGESPLRAPQPTGAEPEEITAESVAMLAGGDRAPGEGGGRRRRRRRGRGRGRRDDEFAGEPGQPHPQGSSQGQGQPQGQQNGGERPPRPMRQNEIDAFAEYLAEGRRLRGEPEPVAPAAEATVADEAAPADADAAAEPVARAPQPQRPPQQPQAPRLQPQPQQNPNRAPRPRAEGPQRPMPSVLDRLCTFSRGILELCNPDTPGWAQPRLSELLAEAGLASIPAQGQPHSEYHEVVGTIATRAVPAGHIAELVAPGFALRGDRGDLFPLRKARVRVAEGGAPVPPPRRDDDQPSDRSDDAPSDLDRAEPPESADAADVPEPDEIAAPDVGGAEPAPERTDGDAEPRPENARRGHDDRRRDDRRRDDDRRGGRDRGPRRDDGAPRRDESAPPAEREPAPEPATGRPPLRTHAREPAGDAPALPLAPQVPDELAAKPKAEGFRALGLNDQILADLAAMGYEKPTPIQEEAIPVVLSSKDMIGQAQTGTGKTAAFVLPMLQKLYSYEGEGPVALVLCPTRELARQVHGEFVKMAGASGARAALIYGGVPMDDQVRALERKPHVVIGTPGRIIDHMRRKVLSLARLRMAVLDEADQMLDIGFWPDVNYIISHTPPSRQMLLFSATFPDPVKQLAEKHMKEPAHVRIAPKQVTVEQVDQKYVAVPRERKTELLAKFIETQNPEQLVVFCRTKHQTDRVAEVLKRKHMSAAAIHGDLPQSKREKTLAAFRARELQCLIATNVAARGLDIPSVSHVVNYDIPEMPEEYVHRIGRTARNGARGVARTFITPEDGQFLVEIEKHIGLLLEEEQVEGFTPAPVDPVAKRTIAAMPAGQTRILKPLVGGIRLGRRR